MPPRLTTDEFILKANVVHDGAYAYNKVVYINSQSLVTIICKHHGEFNQTPNSHLNGRGCLRCGVASNLCRIEKGKPHHSSEFIRKSTDIHEGKYDYSKIVYVNSSTPVVIICPIHTSFSQIPANHLFGKGCPLCANQLRSKKNRGTAESFRMNAEKVHGKTYDYSNVVYLLSHVNVEIICRLHGIFYQSPSLHLSGNGCQMCGAMKSASTKTRGAADEFVAKSRLVHGDKYDYESVNYESNLSKVDIICKIHGVFNQSPQNHLAGKGCQQCGRMRRIASQTDTRDVFIEKAISVHDDKYTYDEVVYLKSNVSVLLKCKKHGEFWIAPNKHLQGRGCPRCSCRSSTPSMEWLNLISVKYEIAHAGNGGEFHIPATRFFADGFCEKTKTIFEFHGDYWHGNPSRFGADVVNMSTKTTFGELYEKTVERQKIIECLGYRVVVMWESEWNKLKKAVVRIQQTFKNKH